ncbi:hypothetical protein [Salinispora vitiensis]|uniref:hypothetical protein n=1 Tax=Salinispora vitiensis TaxID=999544 RepID=UPI0004AF9AE8|nr:hypothetical protein [Salinispora vitiensis]
MSSAVPSSPGTHPPTAFDGTDPVDLNELGAEYRAWRAVLDLLARTGETMPLPAEFAPDPTMLIIAAGWHYQPALRREGDRFVLACTHTGWTPDLLAAQQLLARHGE